MATKPDFNEEVIKFMEYLKKSGKMKAQKLVYPNTVIVNAEDIPDPTILYLLLKTTYDFPSVKRRGIRIIINGVLVDEMRYKRKFFRWFLDLFRQDGFQGLNIIGVAERAA